MEMNEYIQIKYTQLNTPFVITPEGKGYFVENGIRYTREEFEQKYPLPISVVSYHKDRHTNGKRKGYLCIE